MRFYNWAQGKYISVLNEQTYRLIGDFTIFWNIFEKNCFPFQKFNKENIESFADNIQSKNLYLEEIGKVCYKFKSYNSSRGNTIDSLYRCYFFRKQPISKDELESIYQSENIKDNILTLIYFSYRVRNNLFHGLKQIADLNEQVKLFECMNEFLAIIIYIYDGKK